jgi:hypothetical protein
MSLKEPCRLDEEAVLWSATSYQDDSGMVHGCRAIAFTPSLPTCRSLSAGSTRSTSSRAACLRDPPVLRHPATCSAGSTRSTSSRSLSAGSTRSTSSRGLFGGILPFHVIPRLVRGIQLNPDFLIQIPPCRIKYFNNV